MTDEQEKMDSPRFSLAVDDQIIDGFFGDQEAMFRRMKALGFSRDEIMDRTKYLGLSRQFIKRWHIERSDVAMRICLGCSERFLSAGFQNRLCSRCRNRQ